LVALSCAEHLLRPLMLPGPTATKPDRKVKVRFVPVPQEDDEGKHRVPAAFRSPDVAEAVIRHEWVQKGLSCLTAKDRRAIHAYFGDELRGAELAKRLGVSGDHARKPVNRAIKRWHHALSALAEEPQGSNFCSPSP
jgi:DNA-directed RNA polymerase specialized sigma24 family protein